MEELNCVWLGATYCLFTDDSDMKAVWFGLFVFGVLIIFAAGVVGWVRHIMEDWD